MPQTRHALDQLFARLLKADAELGKGNKVLEICKLQEVTTQTYYRWRQKYGGMKLDFINYLEQEKSAKTMTTTASILNVKPMKKQSSDLTASTRSKLTNNNWKKRKTAAL